MLKCSPLSVFWGSGGRRVQHSFPLALSGLLDMAKFHITIAAKGCVCVGGVFVGVVCTFTFSCTI